MRSPTLAAPTSARGFTARLSRGETGVKSTSYPPRKIELESTPSLPRANAAVGSPGARNAPAEATATPAGRMPAARAGPRAPRTLRLATIWTSRVTIETAA